MCSSRSPSANYLLWVDLQQSTTGSSKAVSKSWPYQSMSLPLNYMLHGHSSRSSVELILGVLHGADGGNYGSRISRSHVVIKVLCSYGKCHGICVVSLKLNWDCPWSSGAQLSSPELGDPWHAVLCWLQMAHNDDDGISHTDLTKLQCIQNRVARVVTKWTPFTCSVPLLRSLHRLPVKYRIIFKISLLTYKTFYEKQSVYLHSMLAASLPSHSLRSSKGVRVETSMGAQGFHSCAPSLWDNLTVSAHSAISIATLFP